MTSSRSRTSTSSWLALLVVIAAWIVLIPARADAERRRVVVLELEGPKAEKFHSGLVKLIKKSHTVVPLDKWNETADELGATKVNDKDLKKVAKKLKVDAIVTGKVDKRRDEYILRLKVRAGKSGAVFGNSVEVKSEEGKIVGDVKDALREELIPVIAEVPSNRGGGDDDDDEDEDKPKKPKKPAEDDDEDADDEPTPPREVAKPEKKPERKPEPAVTKKPDRDTEGALETKGDDDEDDSPLPKPKKPRRDVAARDEEGEGEGDGEAIEEEAEGEGLDGAAALAPGERAIDLVAGLSFTARRLSFTYQAGVTSTPAPYSGVPVAGGLVEATFWPMAFGHKRTDMLKNIGLTLMFDRVLFISSKQGDPPITLPTSQSRYAVGATFRYPLGKVTLGAALRYGKQDFTIEPVGMTRPAVPSVTYTIFDPMVSVKFQATSKLTINAAAGFMLITDTGDIQSNMNYGAATVSGLEGDLGVDYHFTDALFVRGAFRFSTIGFAFTGSGALSTMADSDAEQDVFGARDTYLGGAVTAGVLY